MKISVLEAVHDVCAAVSVAVVLYVTATGLADGRGSDEMFAVGAFIALFACGFVATTVFIRRRWWPFRRRLNK